MPIDEQKREFGLIAQLLAARGRQALGCPLFPLSWPLYFTPSGENCVPFAFISQSIEEDSIKTVKRREPLFNATSEGPLSISAPHRKSKYLPNSLFKGSLTEL